MGSGILFSPFASQPELSQTDVYFGSEARLTYRMNDVLRALESHEKFGGSAATDPKFAIGGKSGSFTDEINAAALKPVLYRLMVLYDGMEYTSDTFTVHWTDDPSDAPEKMTTAVELYIKNGKFANGARSYDGGAWVRLDGETEYLVYDVSGSEWIGRARRAGA